MEEFLGILRRKVKEWRKNFDSRHAEASQKIKQMNQVLYSKDSLETEKVKAFLGTVIEDESVERHAYELILLNNLTALASYVEVLWLTVNRIDEEIEKSGILEKVRDIESVKELIDDIEKVKKRVKAEVEETERNEKDIKKKIRYII